MKQYIRVTRSDVDGNYTIPFEQLANMIDGELDGIKTGESVTLTIVEMEESEYDKLEEFEGW